MFIYLQAVICRTSTASIFSLEFLFTIRQFPRDDVHLLDLFNFDIVMNNTKMFQKKRKKKILLLCTYVGEFFLP